MAENDLAENFVILHPGSARAEKFWIARRWAEVVNQMSSQGQIRCRVDRWQVTDGAGSHRAHQIASATVRLSIYQDSSTCLRSLRSSRGRGCSSRSIPRRCTWPARSGCRRSLFSVRPIPIIGVRASTSAIVLQAGKADPMTQFCPTTATCRDEGNLDGTGDRCYADAAVESGSASRMSKIPDPTAKAVSLDDHPHRMAALQAALLLCDALQIPLPPRTRVWVPLRRGHLHPAACHGQGDGGGFQRPRRMARALWRAIRN